MPARVEAKFVGWDKIDKILKGFQDNIQKKAKELLIPAAKLFEDGMKTYIGGVVNPMYSMGALADSVTSVFNLPELTAAIGPDGSAVNRYGESYASWVEFGHIMRDGRWWPGHHYVYNTFRIYAPMVRDYVTVELQGSVKDYAKHVSK